MQVEAGAALQPALHSGMLVGRVIVADQIDLFSAGIVSSIMRRKRSLMAMALLAQAVDFSVRCIQSSEQGGSIALIVMRQRLTAALLQQQTRLCAVQA